MKLIIFDIDGTLVYSNKVDSQCFALTYEKLYRRKFPTIDWSKYPHVSDTTIFNTLIQKHFNRPSKKEEITRFQDHFVELIQKKRLTNPEEFFEVPGARRALKKLVETDGIAVGIATGGWQRPAMVKLAHVGINTHALHMSFANGKHTREDIIQESIDLAKSKHADIERVIYVGDASWDVSTTYNMQLDFIGIRREGDHEVLQKLGANLVLNDFQDFDSFLNAVEKAVPPSRY